MLALLRLLLLVPIAVVASLVALAVCLRRPFDPTNSRRAARLYGWFTLPLLGLKVSVRGWDHIPSEQTFLMIANHQSNLDMPVVGQAVPERTVSLGKQSLRWIPLFGQVYWLAGNILINRADGGSALATMRKVTEALKAGHKSVWIFPEGTRNPGTDLLPFKKGAFVTAIQAEVPIVMVCTARYAARYDWNRLDNGTVQIEILPPLETTGVSPEQAETVMQDCRQRMREVIDRLSASD